MNVLLILITVMLTLFVPILLEVSFVHVTLDIQEMDSHVYFYGLINREKLAFYDKQEKH